MQNGENPKQCNATKAAELGNKPHQEEIYQEVLLWEVLWRKGIRHRLAIAERIALELAGEIGEAAASAVFIGEIVHYIGHGHAGADDVGLDLVAIGFRFSHIQTLLLVFQGALW